MQETEFIAMMVIMIGCAYTSFRLGRREGIHEAIEFLKNEDLSSWKITTEKIFLDFRLEF